MGLYPIDRLTLQNTGSIQGSGILKACILFGEIGVPTATRKSAITYTLYTVSMKNSINREKDSV